MRTPARLAAFAADCRDELGWEPRIDALGALELLRPALSENAPPAGH